MLKERIKMTESSVYQYNNSPSYENDRKELNKEQKEFVKGLAYSVSKSIVRDFFEIQNLKKSNNLMQFLDNTKYRARQNFWKQVKENDLLFEGLECQWVFIPIDGTRNFISGIHAFTVVIIVLLDGIPVFATIYSPLMRELFVCESGLAVYIEDYQNCTKKLEASTNKHNIMIDTNITDELSLPKVVGDLKINYRNIGSTSLGIIYVVASRLEACIRYTANTHVPKYISFLIDLIEMAGVSKHIDTNNSTVLVSNKQMYSFILNSIQATTS